VITELAYCTQGSLIGGYNYERQNGDELPGIGPGSSFYSR
jgi:hypothetical protein